jgi:hypothetical protein
MESTEGSDDQETDAGASKSKSFAGERLRQPSASRYVATPVKPNIRIGDRVGSHKKSPLVTFASNVEVNGVLVRPAFKSKVEIRPLVPSASPVNVSLVPAPVTPK